MNRSWLIGIVVLVVLLGFSFTIKWDEDPRYTVTPGSPPIFIDHKTGDTWLLETGKDGRPQWGLIRR